MTEDKMVEYLDELSKDEEWQRFIDEYMDRFIFFNEKIYDRHKLEEIHERITRKISKSSQDS